MHIKKSLKKKLTQAFKPCCLNIQDESHKHQGHAGYKPGGESHFHVILVSDCFQGQPRLVRHRQVYQVVSEEMEHIHALRLSLHTPDEH